jgi:hypothetical protein
MARHSLRFAKDPYRVVLLVLVVLTISRMHMAVSGLEEIRPLILLTIAALAVAWARPKLLAQRSLLISWPAKVVVALAVWAVFGAVFGLSFGSSATFIVQDFSKTIILTFLILASIRTAKDLYTIIIAYVVSAVWLVYQALFHFKLEMVDQNGGYYRLSHLTTYDANDLGLVLLLGLALTLLVFQVARFRGKVMTGGLLIGIAAAIAKSGSRGALVGLVVFGAAALVLLQSVPILKRCLFVAVTFAGLTVFAPHGYWRQMATIFHPEQDYNWSSDHGRRQVAKRGVGYFEAFPVFGLGVGNFERAECSVTLSANARDRLAHGKGVWCMPPHNSYVQALAESGAGGIVLWLVMIPGAAVWLLVFQRGLPKRWQTGDGEQRLLYFAPVYFALGIIGFSVGAFFLTFAWREVTFYIPAIVAGLDVAVTERLVREGVVRPHAKVASGRAAARAMTTGRPGVRRWIARPVSWAAGTARELPPGGR